jgi:hypothetical protein
VHRFFALKPLAVLWGRRYGNAAGNGHFGWMPWFYWMNIVTPFGHYPRAIPAIRRDGASSKNPVGYAVRTFTWKHGAGNNNALVLLVMCPWLRVIINRLGFWDIWVMVRTAYPSVPGMGQDL